jgi:hypothetical protein
MELLFVEKITNNIKEDKEDSWLCSSLEFKNTDTKPIYINNNLPHMINTTSRKNMYSCGICCRNLQSKIWFQECETDYDIACSHIKWILIAREYSRQQDINKRPWPNNYLFPTTYEQVKLCGIINDNLNKPNLRQTYFSDALENIDSLPPYPIMYDTIYFPDIIYVNNAIVKSKGVFSCNCDLDKYYKSFNKNFNCHHCINIINFENEKQRLREFILFLVFKYFDLV